jgi:hypothetical protein
MKLSQALKLKNRLAGELVRFNQVLQRENTRRSDNPSKVNAEEIYNKIIEISTKLGELKAKIATTNVPIYHLIERMGELKSHISFIQGLPKRDGEEISFVGRDQEKLVYTWKSFINQEDSDKRVAELQEKCDALQDSIDTFNATTEIAA